MRIELTEAAQAEAVELLACFVARPRKWEGLFAAQGHQTNFPIQQGELTHVALNAPPVY